MNLMKWIQGFDLFLFDFDGLLVNTEKLHYAAYVRMMEGRGYQLNWSFPRFCKAAHTNSVAIREGIYADFPALDPDWQTLYNEKKRCYFELISLGKIDLMPGVHELLSELDKHKKRRCVATNSPFEQIQLIRAQLPILRTIPHWITREDYEKPKPDPECYLRAIELHGKPGDRIVGFEDSLRGLKALQGTSALPILISDVLPSPLELGCSLQFASLSSISM